MCMLCVKCILCVSIGKILCVWMVFPSYPLCHLADTILVRGWWSTWSIIDNGTNVLENSLLKIFTYKYKIHTYRNKHTLHTLLEHVDIMFLDPLQTKTPWKKGFKIDWTLVRPPTAGLCVYMYLYLFARLHRSLFRYL